MICERCMHVEVCKYIQNMEEGFKVADNINCEPTPIRLEPRCDALRERDTAVKASDEKRAW